MGAQPHVALDFARAQGGEQLGEIQVPLAFGRAHTD